VEKVSIEVAQLIETANWQLTLNVDVMQINLEIRHCLCDLIGVQAVNCLKGVVATGPKPTRSL